MRRKKSVALLAGAAVLLTSLYLFVDPPSQASPTDPSATEEAERYFLGGSRTLRGFEFQSATEAR